jgi:uncharacterized integral membrane protein (TIGR00697 family)
MIRKFDVIIALYVFGVMTAEIMGAKTFPILSIGSFHLNSSVAIFVMPLLFTITDVVVEVHGARRARSMVLSGLICAALLVLYTSLATHLPPSPRFLPTEPAYDKIFGASTRIAAASLAAFAVSELLDVLIFAKLKEKMYKHALWLRNNVSNFASQLVDSVVFLTLAFYSFHHSLGGNFSFLIGLILPYWALRCALSVVETPLVYLGVRWLRKPDSAELSKLETVEAK